MCVPVWCMPAGAARGVLCRGHTRVAAAPVFHLRQACIWCVAVADVLLCCRTLLFKQHQPNLVLSLAGSHAMRVSAAYSRAAYASNVTWRGKHCMHAVCPEGNSTAYDMHALQSLYCIPGAGPYMYSVTTTPSLWELCMFSCCCQSVAFLCQSATAA